MRPSVADHVVGFLGDRGVELAFGLCGHTNISLLAALERRRVPRIRDHASRAGRGPRCGRLCTCVGSPRGRPPPRRTRADERGDGRGHGVLRLDPDARHRRRRAVVLRGSRPAPGGQPPPRCRPGGCVRAIRQARLARASRRPGAADAGARLGPGPRRTARTGPRIDPHGHPRRAPGGRDRAAIAGGPSDSQHRDGSGHRRGAAERLAAAAPRGRGHASRDRGCARARGADRRAGRPHAHGQRRPATGPSAARRSRRLLGLAVGQPPGVQGGRHPRGRHPLPRDRQQQLGARRHLQHPAHAAHPRRPRPPRAGAQLPHDDRGHGRRRIGTIGHPRSLRGGDAGPRP